MGQAAFWGWGRGVGTRFGQGWRPLAPSRSSAGQTLVKGCGPRTRQGLTSYTSSLPPNARAMKLTWWLLSLATFTAAKKGARISSDRTCREVVAFGGRAGGAVIGPVGVPPAWGALARRRRHRPGAARRARRWPAASSVPRAPAETRCCKQGRVPVKRGQRNPVPLCQAGPRSAPGRRKGRQSF